MIERKLISGTLANKLTGGASKQELAAELAVIVCAVSRSFAATLSDELSERLLELDG
jgi:hypothetical protein